MSIQRTSDPSGLFAAAGSIPDIAEELLMSAAVAEGAGPEALLAINVAKAFTPAAKRAWNKSKLKSKLKRRFKPRFERARARFQRFDRAAQHATRLGRIVRDSEYADQRESVRGTAGRFVDYGNRFGY